MSHGPRWRNCSAPKIRRSNGEAGGQGGRGAEGQGENREV